MFVVKRVPVCNFILLIFACVVLRKLHVHSLFTLETVGFSPLSDKYEKIILFVFISHIVFYKIIPDR